MRLRAKALAPPQDDAHCQVEGGLVQHKGDDVCLPAPQCHAHTDLARAAAGGIGHDAVDPCRGQENCDERKDSEEPGEEPGEEQREKQ